MCVCELQLLSDELLNQFPLSLFLAGDPDVKPAGDPDPTHISKSGKD